MAQKRMFDLSIIDQDKFIDLPVSSRLLYYELGMRADDDGFIAPKKIIRMLGLSDDDLKILIIKGFLIQFDDGVVVITNWKTNNLIRSDRYKPTLYQDHLKSLKINADNSYTFGIPNDNQMTAQYSIVKSSIVKSSNIYKRAGKPAPSLTQEQLAQPLAQFKLSHSHLTKICQEELIKVIAYLRDHQGRRFATANAKALNNYKKIRLLYGKQDVINSINNAHEDEYHKQTKYKYLTPEFLFRQDKFEKFL